MDASQQLDESVADNAKHIERLELELAQMLEASESSNAADEHDPEGATIAFERQQLVSLLAQARRSGRDLERALERLHDGTYGVCVACGRSIGIDRLEARPASTTCIACARQSGRPS